MDKIKKLLIMNAWVIFGAFIFSVAGGVLKINGAEANIIEVFMFGGLVGFVIDKGIDHCVAMIKALL